MARPRARAGKEHEPRTAEKPAPVRLRFGARLRGLAHEQTPDESSARTQAAPACSVTDYWASGPGGTARPFSVKPHGTTDRCC